MQKLRKGMTVLAILGTVFVTALFCYMPVRDILRESVSQDVSLMQQTAAEAEQATGNQGTESEKADGEVIEGEVIDGEATAGEVAGQEVPGVTLTVRTLPEQGGVSGESQEITVTLWQSAEGTCYFFLPGFALDAKIVLQSAGTGQSLLTGREKGSLQIGNAHLQAGDTLTDIVWEEAYALTVYDEENLAVLEAPVIFMRSSQLPVLSLRTDSASMEWIDGEKGNEEAGEALLLDEEGNTLYAGQMDSFKGRGNSTWGLAKKPYQMKLKEKADLFGLGEAGTYILLANGYDETGLRNDLSLGLAKTLGMSYVPQGQMVDLYINDVFYGNYYLCEKVEVGENRVAIRDMEEITNALYRTRELEELEQLQNPEGTRKWSDIQYEDDDLSGGYLFEREMEIRYAQEASGFVTTQGDHYALQSPAYASQSQLNYIADLMQEFQDAIEQEDGIHPETGKHYSEYINVDSFLQKYLVDEITKNYDGGVTSSFFYKPQDAVSTQIFAGPVWDYDLAFGNCDLDEIAGNPIGITKLATHVYSTDIFACLYEQSDFYSEMISLYEEKALPYLNFLLEEGIDAMVTQSRDSMAMDRIRWESVENRYQYYEEYDNSVRSLKYYVEKRREFLNEVWLEGVVYHDVVFEIDGEPWKIYPVRDGEPAGTAPVPFKNDFLFAQWLSESRDVAYDEYKPVYEDMRFYALWQELPGREE